MKLLFNVFRFLFLLKIGFAQTDSIAPRILLPNGWSLTPLVSLCHWAIYH